MPQRSQRHRQEFQGQAMRINSLSPSTGVQSTQITLQVLGSNFRSGDVIVWNGSPVTTSFVSTAQLNATLTLPATPGAIPVMVRRGSVDTNQVTFTVT